MCPGNWLISLSVKRSVCKPSWLKIAASLVLLTIGCAMAGCGYHPAHYPGRSSAVAGRALHVPIFANKSYRPGLEASIVEAELQRAKEAAEAQTADKLVTAEGIHDSIIADNRLNRNVPLEISVLAIGYRLDGHVYHLLPPRPPLSLDVIYLCADNEVCEFTGAGRFGYFRHLLRAVDLPIGELLAAHIQQVQSCQVENGTLSRMCFGLFVACAW